MAICSSGTHAEKCAEKVAEKVGEKSAEKFSAYNSSVLRPWHEPFGRPFQTRHTDPSPDAALQVRESLISVEAPNLLSVQTCFNSKLSAKHVSHTHVKMATLMRQNVWKHFGPQKIQNPRFSQVLAKMPKRHAGALKVSSPAVDSKSQTRDPPQLKYGSNNHTTRRSAHHHTRNTK